MEEKTGRIGYFFLGLVALVWGVNFGIVKSAYRELPPIPFGAIRFTASGTLILLLTFWREKGLRIGKEDLTPVALVGGLGLGLYQVLWSIGLNLTSATNSALILSIQPLVGAFYEDWSQGKSLAMEKYLNMFLSLGGVILVILKPTATLRLSFDTLPGDLLTLMAACCSAIFFTARAKPLLKTYSAVRLMGYCMVITALVLWAIFPFSSPSVAWHQVGIETWGALGYAIVFSGIIGHVLWYEGIGRVGVTKTLVSMYFVPICAVLFNALSMGERIYPQQALGGALILLGVHRVLRT